MAIYILYGFKTAPVTYTLSDLEKTFTDLIIQKQEKARFVVMCLVEVITFYTAYMVNDHDDFVHRVELVSNGFLIRKDYFTYGRVYSEYHAPLDNAAQFYIIAVSLMKMVVLPMKKSLMMIV